MRFSRFPRRSVRQQLWDEEQEQREARFREEDGIPREEAAYCEVCENWVREDEMVPNPLEPRIPGWRGRPPSTKPPPSEVCAACADHIRSEMFKCPNCGRLVTADPQLHDGEWYRCDRCNQEACFSCLPIKPAPHGGYWDRERYQWICSRCMDAVEAEHRRQRKREFGDPGPRAPEPPF